MIYDDNRRCSLSSRIVSHIRCVSHDDSTDIQPDPQHLEFTSCDVERLICDPLQEVVRHPDARMAETCIP